jgi:hypothetical protein
MPGDGLGALEWIQVKSGPDPMEIATIIVSPRARDIPRMKAATIPDTAAGTTIRAPSAGSPHGVGGFAQRAAQR